MKSIIINYWFPIEKLYKYEVILTNLSTRRIDRYVNLKKSNSVATWNIIDEETFLSLI